LQLLPILDPEKTITGEDIEVQLREALITLPEFSGVVIPETDIMKGALPRLEFESRQDFIWFERLENSSINEDEDIPFRYY